MTFHSPTRGVEHAGADVEPRTGRDENEGEHPVRALERHHHRDGTTGGVPDEDGLRHLGLVHPAEDVAGIVLVGVEGLFLHALAAAGEIDVEHAVGAGEEFPLPLPGEMVVAGPVDEDEIEQIWPPGLARGRHDVAQALVDDVPGDDLPPGGEVVRAAVPVFQVVRVLPDIAAEERRSPLLQDAVLVGQRHDLQALRERSTTRNAHPEPKCLAAASAKSD